MEVGLHPEETAAPPPGFEPPAPPVPAPAPARVPAPVPARVPVPAPVPAPAPVRVPVARPATRRTLRRTLDAIRRAVRGHGLWSPGTPLLLACSGGLDSLVALALLDELRPSLGHTLAVGHVDHGLGPHSAPAAAAVAQAAAARGLPFGVRELNLQPGADLEARARTARYAALHDLRQELGCTLVATAHHADDQAETLLLRLGRGAGLDALAGVRLIRADGVVRPLLGVGRAELAACAEILGLRPVEDPSNADPAFCRNRLRHRVLPELEAALPGAAAGLSRTAALLAEHEATLDTWIARALGPALQLDPSRRLATLPASAVPPEPGPRAALLRHVCRRLGTPLPSQRATAQFLALAATDRPGTCRVRGLVVERGPAAWQFHLGDVAETRGAD